MNSYHSYTFENCLLGSHLRNLILSSSIFTATLDKETALDGLYATFQSGAFQQQTTI